MEKKLHYQITAQDNHLSVEAFLKARGFSRTILVHLKRTPLGITVDGLPAYTTHRLQTGEMLSIRLLEEKPSEHIVPAPVPVDILYEDEDLMVINKAAGIPVHPSQGNFDNTLANGLARCFEKRGEAFVFRAVNRLDRDTSGLMLVAKHMLSGAVLGSMAAEKAIHREYLAIASGETDESGTIRLPIARKDGSTIERCIDPVRGEAACTHYTRLAYYPEPDCSLLKVTLETGRTHQIRVHMKAIGHPLLGDFLYYPDFRLIGRQALHSHFLSFTHPITGETMEFTAPLPEDFYFLSPLG